MSRFPFVMPTLADRWAKKTKRKTELELLNLKEDIFAHLEYDEEAERAEREGENPEAMETAQEVNLRNATGSNTENKAKMAMYKPQMNTQRVRYC